MFTFMTAALLAFAPVSLQSLPGVPPIVADAIVAAVNADPSPPLMGSYLAEARLMAVYARRESGGAVRAVGDHGASLGLWQLQRVLPQVAFDPRLNAVIWLARAHEAYAHCEMLEEPSRLAALVSGNCQHGTLVARSRYVEALAEAPAGASVE